MGDNVPSRSSFYFSAHQDDWQLFMNPSAFRDVTDGNTKTIFIHMTAGDAGLGITDGGRKFPLYLARENGAESAIRFMADSDNQRPVEQSASSMTFNGHSIRRASYRNTAAYFLRLPDGSPSGSGYPQTQSQSLKRLSEDAIGMLSAIDGTTRYEGWRDLVVTLRAIIDFERGHAAAVQLNIPELDPAVNSKDHSDHVMTARAALDAVIDLSCVRVHYVGYASADLPENLNAYERDLKCSVYAVTMAGVLACDHPVAWQHYDKTFVGRSYSRTETPSKR